MTIHHIGYAVRDIEIACQVFLEMGFVTAGEVFSDSSRKVAIQLLKNGDNLIELVAPDGEGAPVAGFLDKGGPGTYHLCYVVDDIDKEVDRLKKIKFKVVIDVLYAPALGNAKVAFLYNINIGLIELVQFIIM